MIGFLNVRFRYLKGVLFSGFSLVIILFLFGFCSVRLKLERVICKVDLMYFVCI